MVGSSNAYKDTSEYSHNTEHVTLYDIKDFADVIRRFKILTWQWEGGGGEGGHCGPHIATSV